jgi:hypothetical protein
LAHAKVDAQSALERTEQMTQTGLKSTKAAASPCATAYWHPLFPAQSCARACCVRGPAGHRCQDRRAWATAQAWTCRHTSHSQYQHTLLGITYGPQAQSGLQRIAAAACHARTPANIRPQSCHQLVHRRHPPFTPLIPGAPVRHLPAGALLLSYQLRLAPLPVLARHCLIIARQHGLGAKKARDQVLNSPACEGPQDVAGVGQLLGQGVRDVQTTCVTSVQSNKFSTIRTPNSAAPPLTRPLLCLGCNKCKQW